MKRKAASRPSYAESSSEEESTTATAKTVPHKSSGRTSKYFGQAKKEDSDSEAGGLTGAAEAEEDSIYTSSDDASAESFEEDESSSEPSSPAVDRKRKKSNSARPSKAPKKVAAPTSSKHTAKTKDKEEDSDAESGVSGEYFVAKLPALPEGDVAYAANTIHPNTMTFLRDLRKNNERDWFQQRDLQYQAAKRDFDSFVESLGHTIRSVDDTIPELPLKDLTFRIYRDIRFSNDRTPYKTFLSAYHSRGGRKGRYAGYYISLEPGNKTLLACGRWQPPPDHLASIRTSIAEEPEVWSQVLDDHGFVEFFKGRMGVLKTEDKLKTCPKGFPKDHKQIDLLRLKSFNVSMTFKDEEVLQEGFLDILAVILEQMEPFVSLLNDAVYPPDTDAEAD